MSILQNSNAISAGGYDINNSLRFRRSASAYLTRTPASAGNQKTYTISFWYKRGLLTSQQGLFEGYVNSGTLTSFNINTDTFNLQIYNSPSYNVVWATTAVFRDPSAWYHVVLTVDTTQASQSNMVKLYINGVQQTFNYTNYIGSIAQNTNTNINASGTGQYIGVYNYNGSYQDGYFAEYYLIDGQALTPSSFGETDTTTGSWKPKAYTGTYGTNGFYLKFSDIATTSGSNAGLGKDFSGNSNYWTTNNISVTSGTTYDAMTDSPTLTSATVANYAVLNPLWKGSVLTLAGANLNVTSSGLTGSALSTIAMESGKYYCEVRLNSSTDATIIGIAISSFNPTTSSLSGAGGVGYYVSNGDKFVNGTQTAYGASCASGDIVGIAVDITAGTITFYKNNVSQGAITHGLTGPFYFATSDVSSGSNIDQSWNFGQRPFSYTPPTGYVALNTYNLPDSTIKKGNSYMDATTYTGTGSNPRSVTNTSGFKPDFVWIKSRSTADWHILSDSIRGANNVLYSNSTAAQQVNDGNGYLSAFNSNGFSVTNGGTSANNVNTNGSTYVGWQWQAGQGSTSSNTSGSITSTVSVNTTAGFSVVTYTGNNTSGATVGHGLGVAPKMVIVKNRSTTTDWGVYHSSLSANNTIWLNLNNAQQAISGTGQGGISATSSTTFTCTNGTTNGIVANGNGNSMVAYCFAEIAGFSKFGSYTGNGSTDGTFVYLGFRPKYIMIKNTAAAQDWDVRDTARDTYNASQYELYPNQSSAEVNSSSRTPTNYLDILSNGFKLRGTNPETNNSGTTYIYAAFAENPFKNSLAR